MAVAVRIRHRTLAGCVVVVVRDDLPYPSPSPCLSCGTSHTHKAIHLSLEDDGTALVSEGVFGLLQQGGAFADDGPFLLAGSVDDPPPIQLSISRNGRVERLRQRPTIHI